MQPHVSHRHPSLLHRLEFALYRGVECILSMMSIEDCVRLGRGIGSVIHACSPSYRRLVRRNLRIATALEGIDPANLDKLVVETFRRGAANFLGTLRTEFSRTEELLERIDTEGLDILETTENKDRGFLIAMPHMGNWEALTRLGSTYSSNRRYGGVYRPLQNPLMDDLTRERRTSGGAQLFSRKDGFHPPASLLRDGGVLVVLADQRAGGSGEVIPFFGKLTSCSPLPNLLARRSKARVASLSISSSGDGRWKLCMMPIDEGSNTPEIMSQLEAAMRLSLPDVFWFHDRWRTDRARPLSFFTKVRPGVAEAASVPLRLILTTPPSTPESQANALITTMLQLRPDLRVEWMTSTARKSPDPRVIIHSWDPSTPPEQIPGRLESIDMSHAAPLDGALIFDNDESLGRAARCMGLRAVIGLGVSGKPWTGSYPAATTEEEWAGIASQLAWYPTRRIKK